MAIIAEFDTDPVLIIIRDKHHAWHTFPGGAHGYPSRQFPMGAPGSGHEFFQFHLDVINQFFAWNNVHHAAAPADIAGWTAIPMELKVPETGWPTPFGINLADAEARINSNMPPFASDDELGIHVETTIHNWIHGAVAASSIFNLSAAEKNIIQLFHSVHSTYFYKIHGLVQFWWDRWLHPKTHIKELVDHPKLVILDFPGAKQLIDTPITKFPEKFKDLVEAKGLAEIVDPFKQQTDPGLIKNMIERIATLEAQAGVKASPFIKPLERPEVGEAIAKKDKNQEKQQ